MAQKKRKANKRPVKKEKSKGSKQIKAILLFAIAIFLLAIVFIPAAKLGVVGAGIKSFCFGLFGFCAYIFPIVLGIIAFMIAFEKKSESTITIVFALLFIVFLNASFEIFGHTEIEGLNYFEYIVEAYKHGSQNLSGGVLGGLLAYPITYFLGAPLNYITIVILMTVSLMITTGTTLQQVGTVAKRTGEKAKKVHNDTKEWLEQRALEHEQEEQNKKAKFDVDVSLDGMPDHPLVLDELYKEKEAKEQAAKQAEIEEVLSISVEESEAEIKKKEKQEVIKQTTKVATEIEASKEKKSKKKVSEVSNYVFPPIELLSPTKNANTHLVEAELKSNSELLVNVLKSFGVEVRVTGYSRGPSVTRYEIQPSVGVRISKITGLADDIALQLRASSIRISPIPNKSSIGVEVPNTNSSVVGMRDIISGAEFKNAKSKLLVALGQDVTGQTAFCDISKMPHLLVAGTTGSGKSVCLNTMIMSILYRANPDEVKFVMIDPKAVEFPVYNGIPHLLIPVVTDSRKAAGALGWAVVEMEKRYTTLAENGVRNIGGYNELCKKNKELEPMPHIVIIIDEFADLMMVAGNEVESSVCRIAQKARAAGMHLVIATQRPSADIFTGLIKSNIPSRIALSVSSKVNSQIIIDMPGAEKLLGKGDMLYLPIGSQKPHRIQGCFVSDEEVKSVADFIIAHSDENEYDQEVLCEIERQAAEDNSKKSSFGDSGDFGDYDARINEAIDLVVEMGTASTSTLQRKLKLGYARAARIIDQLEERGIVGPHQGAKPREVLISKQDWMQMQTSGVASANKSEPSVKQLSFDDTQATESAREVEEVVLPEPETELVHEKEDVVFTDDNEPSVRLDNDEDKDDDLDFIDEDFLGSI